MGYFIGFIAFASFVYWASYSWESTLRKRYEFVKKYHPDMTWEEFEAINDKIKININPDNRIVIDKQ